MDSYSTSQDKPAFKKGTGHLLHKAHPLRTDKDLDKLIEDIGDSKYVLLGEASHGTHEYYTWRTRISRRLIEEKDFSFVAVEGDWPDCYRINRFIKHYANSGNSAREVLQQFERWPTWMWANWEVLALVEWLRSHNAQKSLQTRTGFYGLDVYSLWESMEAIVGYLEKEDPEAAKVAKKAYQCFEPFGDKEGQGYANSLRFAPEGCEKEVVDLLKEIRSKAPAYNHDREASLNSEQNAEVIRNAEKYYRAMIGGGPESWNIRDTHMMDTLNRLMEHHGTEAKCIVWEHNTHIGDARATDMARQGMVNIGQLAREQHADKGVYLVGFGSYRGNVIAGESWGAPMKVMRVPDARSGSWEEMLSAASEQDKYVLSKDLVDEEVFSARFNHRAIGVVYNPDYEAYGNYVPSHIPQRYDAFMYLHETQALHPLHMKPRGTEMPETYPFGV